MVHLGDTLLTGVIVTMGLVAIAGSNMAFAQQSTCGEQPFVYNVGCTPLNTAQLYGAVLVAGVAAFAIALGVAGARHHMIH